MMGQVEVLLRGLRAGQCSPKQVAQQLERIRQVMERYLRRATALLDVAPSGGRPARRSHRGYDRCGSARDLSRGRYHGPIAMSPGLAALWRRSLLVL